MFKGRLRRMLAAMPVVPLLVSCATPGKPDAPSTSVSDEDPMVSLCKLIVGTTHEDLPTEVVEFAKRHIMDQISITMGGSGQEGVRAVVDLVKEQGGKEESFIPFYGGKVPAPLAGMAIGPMARALDLGDVHPDNGHTAEYVLPAVLGSLGLKDRVSGKELITAFVLGEEVLVRVGAGTQAFKQPGGLVDQLGFYIFGCTAAVAKLLELDLEQTIAAMGMAKAMTQPHDMAMYMPATLMVRVHHGFVAQDAITCCLLAKRGITGPKEILLGPRGFYQVLTKGTWEVQPELVTRGLGEQWSFIRTMFKPYTACKFTHTGVTAMIELMEEHGFKPQDIAKVHGDISVAAWMICTPTEAKWNPQTEYDAQFSFPYTVATAAFEKKFFMEEYKEPARARRDVRELMTKVTAAKDPELGDFVTRLTVPLKDGREFTKVCSIVKGCSEKPFSWEDIKDRAKSLAPYSAYKVGDETLDLLIERVRTLEAVEDVVEEVMLPITPRT
jgi:2-methylcitrate dehydratase PrpD